MHFSHSYVSELEELIVGTLLPTYIQYYDDKKLLVPSINQELLSRIRKKPPVAALFKPHEKQT